MVLECQCSLLDAAVDRKRSILEVEHAMLPSALQHFVEGLRGGLVHHSYSESAGK